MDPEYRSVNKLKVQELRDLCKRNNLDSSGTKPILVQRLKDHITKSQSPHGISDTAYSFSTDNSMERYDSNPVGEDESANNEDEEHHSDEDSEINTSFDNEPQYIYSDQEGTDYEEEMLPEDYEKASSGNDEDAQVLENNKDDAQHNEDAHLMEHEREEEKSSPVHTDSHDTTPPIAVVNSTAPQKTKKVPIVPPSAIEPETESFEHLSLDIRRDIFQLDSCIIWDVFLVLTNSYHIDNSDLNFVMTNSNCLQGRNLTQNDLSHFWCSSTTNYGVKTGCKVYFECKYIRNLDVNLPVYEIPEHALRIGFTTKDISHLGDSPQSIGFESSGKLYQNSKVISQNLTKFGVNDVVGIFLDTTCDPAVFSASINGIIVRDAVAKLPLSGDTLSNAPGAEDEWTQVLPDTLYPCIYFKNVEFSVNFNLNSPIPEQKEFHPIDSMETKSFMAPNALPITIDQCEVIMMSGIVGCGKSTWVSKFVVDKLPQKYTVINRATLFERWRVIGQHRKARLSESVLAAAIAKFASLASERPCCCILDQSNCHSSSRKKRMDSFSKFPSRKAVVIIPHLSEYAARIAKKEQEMKKSESGDRAIHETDIIRYKKSYSLPTTKEGFTEIIYDDSTSHEAKRVVNDYRFDADRLREFSKFKSQRKILLNRVSHLNSKLRITSEQAPLRSVSSTNRAPLTHSPQKSAVSNYSSRINPRSRSPSREFGTRSNNPHRPPPYQYDSRDDAILPRTHESRKRTAPPSMLPPPPPPPPSTMSQYTGSSRRGFINASTSRDSYRSAVVRATYSSNQRDQSSVYNNDGYNVGRARSNRMNNVDTTVAHGYRNNPINYDARSSLSRNNTRSSLNDNFGRGRTDRFRGTDSTSRPRFDNSRNTGGFRSSNTPPRTVTNSMTHSNSNWGGSHYNNSDYPTMDARQPNHLNRQWDSTRAHQSSKPRSDYGGFSEKSPLRSSRDTPRNSFRARYD